MGNFSLKATENQPAKTTEEWDFEEDIQDAEMVEEKPKTNKSTKKKTKK